MNGTRVTADARVFRNEDKPGGFHQSLSPSSRREELPSQYGKFLHHLLQQNHLCCWPLQLHSARLCRGLVPCGGGRIQPPHCQMSLPQAWISHWESKTVFKYKSPACDIFYNETGFTFAFATRCKQLLFPTAWPFIVANLHICILNKMAPGRSPRLSNEIFCPSEILHTQWLTCFLDCIIYCG